MLRASVRIIALATLLTAILSLLEGCGGGSASPTPTQSIVVEIGSPTSTTLSAGSSSLTLKAVVSNDPKNAGVAWSLTPSTCGSLSGSGLQATYAPPSESTLSADCTATITASAVSDMGKSASLSLTVKAVSIVPSSGMSGAMSATAGGAPLTLSASLANDASGTGTILWSLQKATATRRAMAQATDACGSLSAASGASVVYTPPAAEACTATVTATSSVNASVKQSFAITVLLPTIGISLSPSTTQTLVAGASSLPITATLTNDVQRQGVAWSQSASACGALSATVGASVDFAPAIGLRAACSTIVTATAVADSSRTATLPLVVDPVSVTIVAPASAPTLTAGAQQTITAVTNDAAGAGALQWTLKGCGSLASTSGATVVYTAPKGVDAPCSATATAASASDAGRTAALTIRVNPIVVAIASPSSPQTMLSGAGAQAIVAATNDPAGAAALQWTLSGCGSLASTSGATNAYAPLVLLSAACTATATATSPTDATRSASLTYNVTPATLSLTLLTPASGQASVAVGGSQPIVASLYNDASGAGMTATLAPSGCGAIGAMTRQSASGATTVYSGAYAAADHACATTLTLASAADASKKATLSLVSQPPIAVTLTPAGAATVDLNDALTIQTTVANDAAGKGVALTLNPAGCGSLSAATAGSGASVVFTPAMSGCATTLTATSLADAGKSATLSLTVAPALTLDAAVTNGAGSAYAGLSYAGYIRAAGGPGGPLTWTVTGLGDNLATDAGANVGARLNITGAPTAAGLLNFAVSVKDATGKSVSNVYTLNVQNYAPLGLPTQASLNNGQLGSAYAQTLQASGGADPYAFIVNGLQLSATAATVPNSGGLQASSDGATLRFSGSPSTAGVYSIGVTVNDRTAASVTRSYTLAINSAPAFANGAGDVPQGMVGMPYSMRFYASGGKSPYTFSFNSMLSGLTGYANGLVQGSPTAAGAMDVRVTITDANGLTAVKNFKISALPAPEGSENALLSGQYACMLELDSDAATPVGGGAMQRGGMIFAFKADGSGAVGKYEYDMSTPEGGYVSATVSSTNDAAAGAYALGPDGVGYLLIGAHVLGVVGFDVNDSGHFNQLRIVAMDDVGATQSHRHGGGQCYRQIAPSGSATGLTGNATGIEGNYMSGGYVFGLRGESAEGRPMSAVGSMQFDGAGGVSHGVMDSVSGNVLAAAQTLPGKTQTAADAMGRIVISDSFGAPWIALYVTNQGDGQAFLIGANAHSGGSYLMGEARWIQASSLSSPFSGRGVLYASGAHVDATQSAVEGASMLQYSASSSGAFRMNASMTQDGSAMSLNQSPAPGAVYYSTDATTGRSILYANSSRDAASELSGIVLYAYNADAAAALLADGDDDGGRNNKLGWIEAQTAPTSGWTAEAMAGRLALGRLYNGDVARQIWAGVGQMSSGAMTLLDQYESGAYWANWQGQQNTVRGVQTIDFTPDSALDAARQFGAYLATQSAGGEMSTMHCLALSPSASAQSGAKGAAVCINDVDDSPAPIFIRE